VFFAFSNWRMFLRDTIFNGTSWILNRVESVREVVEANRRDREVCEKDSRRMDGGEVFAQHCN